jgi:hypothetical protein
MRTVRKSLWALSILACFGLAGCGGSVSENSARTAYEKWTEALSEGKAKLISFRKINARKGEVLGVKFYDVEYESELEFLEDFPPQPPKEPPAKFSEMPKIVLPRIVHGPTGKKGEVKKQRGWLNFEETERGWRGPDKNVY